MTALAPPVSVVPLFGAAHLPRTPSRPYMKVLAMSYRVTISPDQTVATVHRRLVRALPLYPVHVKTIYRDDFPRLMNAAGETIRDDSYRVQERRRARGIVASALSRLFGWEMPS